MAIIAVTATLVFTQNQGVPDSRFGGTGDYPGDVRPNSANPNIVVVSPAANVLLPASGWVQNTNTYKLNQHKITVVG